MNQSLKRKKTMLSTAKYDYHFNELINSGNINLSLDYTNYPSLVGDSFFWKDYNLIVSSCSRQHSHSRSPQPEPRKGSPRLAPLIRLFTIHGNKRILMHAKIQSGRIAVPITFIYPRVRNHHLVPKRCKVP
jgi:hypothetical protein